MTRFAPYGLTVLLCAALLAFAPSALAVDGIVLINQNTSVSGLPGCPTGGHFPIVICQSGSYRLSGNLTVTNASTDAILVSTDNVSIDLNGFSIVGPSVCTGIPVTSCSPGSTVIGSGEGVDGALHSNIAVVNGSVRGMGDAGIILGPGGKVENIRAESNFFNGIFVTSGTVVGNTVVSNGGNGISAGLESVGPNPFVGGNIVSGNLAFGNQYSGIDVTCPSSVVGNTANTNGFGNLGTHFGGCAVANNAAP
jgi:hypothetical protein